VLGPAKGFDATFISDEKAMQYLLKFSPDKEVDLHAMYPVSPASVIDMVKRMLHLNPFFRASFEECLSN